MLITLQELELHDVHFEVDVPAGEIDYDSKLTQASVLHSEGTAALLSRSLGEIRIQGDLKVAVGAICDRCLDAVTLPIENHFDLVYMPSTEAAKGGEDEIDRAGVEIGYYDSRGLALNDILREVVLLALPMQLVCGEGCKGICPVCGQNRNQRECGCHPEPPDDRWNKLKSLRAEISPRH
ncbi:MAG TPA: DUF177 domain-containing protein [Bryobacteraceae bacterium]|jgi:uncharacterized protein